MRRRTVVRLSVAVGGMALALVVSLLPAVMHNDPRLAVGGASAAFVLTATFWLLLRITPDRRAGYVPTASGCSTPPADGPGAADWRGFADDLPQPFLELDTAGVAVFANRAAVTWLGSSAGALALGGGGLLKLVAPCDQRKALRAFLRARRGKRPASVQVTMYLGERRAFLLVLPFPAKAGGAVAAVRVIAADLSAQKDAEVALRRSDLRLRTLLSSLPVAAYEAVVPSPLDAVWMSNSIRRLTGVDAHRFVTEPRFWSSRIHPDDAARVVEEYRQGAARGEVHVEYRWRVADGTYRRFADHALCVRRADGTFFATGVIRDVTNERALAETIRRSEQYYRGLFERSHDATLVFDPESEVILDANEAASGAYQVPRDELVGMSLVAVSRDVGRGRQKIAEVLTNGSVPPFETTQVRRDGSEITFEVRASAVEFGGRPAILSVNRDITERRELEARLRRAEKLEALGQLAAVVAHRFNNLMAVILGASDLCVRHSHAGAPCTGQFEQIRAAILLGKTLTTSLLGCVGNYPLQRQNLDLRGLVERSLPALRRMVPAGITLACEAGLEPVVVQADDELLRQVILHLVTNAWEALPEGGEIRLEIRTVELGRGRPSGRLEGPGKYGLLRVRDQGRGMTASVLARAFDPFFTTKEPPAQGLGLSLVLGIARQHGGIVDITSGPGQGTVIDVYLPIHEGPTSPPAAETSEPEPGRNERILLVEDEPSLRAVLAGLLESIGYQVTAIGDGKAALDVLSSGCEPYDLVFSDLAMPRLGGLELYHQARAQGFATPFLLTSGHSEDPRVIALLLDPRTAFIRKPADIASIAAAIRGLLDAGSAPSDGRG